MRAIVWKTLLLSGMCLLLVACSSSLRPPTEPTAVTASAVEVQVSPDEAPPDQQPPVSSEATGEVQERGVIRDHRTPLGTFAPTQKTPSSGQLSVQPFVPAVVPNPPAFGSLPGDFAIRSYLKNTPFTARDGGHHSIDAVIDKDLASALLAQQIGADILVILTAVDKVALNFGKAERRELDRLNVAEARQYHAAGHFPAGSMGPKILAAVNFLENGGKKVLICSLENVEAALAGKSGTVIWR